MAIGIDATTLETNAAMSIELLPSAAGQPERSY